MPPAAPVHATSAVLKLSLAVAIPLNLDGTAALPTDAKHRCRLAGKAIKLKMANCWWILHNVLNRPA